MNRQEYQQKYQKQLKELDLIGFYKIFRSKDCQYYKSFKISKPLDFYHLGKIDYAIFYNPETKDISCVWENDWECEGLNNDDFVNEIVSSIYGGDYPQDVKDDYEKQCKIELIKENEKRKQIRFEIGQCDVGDTVEIIKGRKLPIGEIKTIKEFKKYYDMYGMYRSTYAIFTDGTKTNVDNCKLIKQA